MEKSTLEQLNALMEQNIKENKSFEEEFKHLEEGIWLEDGVLLQIPFLIDRKLASMSFKNDIEDEDKNAKLEAVMSEAKILKEAFEREHHKPADVVFIECDYFVETGLGRALSQNHKAGDTPKFLDCLLVLFGASKAFHESGEYAELRLNGLKILFECKADLDALIEFGVFEFDEEKTHPAYHLRDGKGFSTRKYGIWKLNPSKGQVRDASRSCPTNIRHMELDDILVIQYEGAKERNGY